METAEDIAAGELMNVLAAYRNKGLDAAIATFAVALRSYAAAVTQAASASACEQCAGGDEPTYHEDWMAWYHGEKPCAGTSIRHAIQVAMP